MSDPTPPFSERLRQLLNQKFMHHYRFYQPQDLSLEQWQAIDQGNFEPFLKLHVTKVLDRISVDRATMIRNALREHGSLAGQTLLDLGCNTGFFSHYFARQGMTVTGIDSNSHNAVKGTTADAATSVIATAERLSRAYHLSATFIERDIFSYLETKPSFDNVLCLSLFHHFFEVGIGYGVTQEKDTDHLFAQIAAVAKKRLYFEIDHRLADRHGWLEADLPKLLQEKGGFSQVNLIGLSVDAWQRYRNLYECRR